MGAYTVSTKPRFGAAALVRSISDPSSSSTAPTPSTSNMETDPTQEKDSHRHRHRRRRRNRSERDQPVDEDTNPPRNKRHRVSVEEVPDSGDPYPTIGHPPRPIDSGSNPANPSATSSYYMGLYVEEFPDPLAGAPISDELVPPPDLAAYMRSVGPMADPEHFEAAELLMTSGLTNVDKDRHLKSKKYAGKTPWDCCEAMQRDVDKLAHGPEFKQYKIPLFDGRRPRPQYMVCRDIIHIMRDFFANPAFKDHMRYKPWRLYTSAGKTEWVYADMVGSDWWWKEMENLITQGHRNGTLAPLIIATDQTTLSVMCGGQKAYPVYVSFGNLDKSWRRKPSKHGMYLLGYLPVDSFEDVPDDDERKRLKADLVHRVMEKMLEPLRAASEHGVEVWCPDGRKRHVFPRVAAYTADWPEQNLQCSTSEGRCPICKTAYKGRGQLGDEAELREREETLNALRTYIRTKNEAHLDLLGLKPVWPWWGDIPGVNLSECLTPDLLHQTYQGLFRHLVKWMKKIIGVDVLDERFAAMLQAEGLARFTKGISVVGSSRWTGRDSKRMLAQFLPVVVGTLSPELSAMVCALVNFMYRAHASSLTDADLDAMDEDLRVFHQHKHLLIRKVYKDEGRFDKIAKLHMLRHWTHSIRELGTPDGYNMETPEQLHIEYAKVPWRASNKVEPLPQMVKYIQRQEAIRIHWGYLDQYLAGDTEEPIDVEGEAEDDGDENDLVEHESREVGRDGGHVQQPETTANGAENESHPASEPVAYLDPVRCLASIPTFRKKPIREVIDRYLASNIIPEIKNFLVRRCNVPGHDILLSRGNHVDIWHKLYLYHPPPSFAPFNPIRRDVVRTRPPPPHAGDSELGVWDVALYLEKPNRLRSNNPYDKHGIERKGFMIAIVSARNIDYGYVLLSGYRAGRVRAIFTLPAHLQKYHPGPLAYLELFTPFGTHVSPFSLMHGTRVDIDSRGLRRTLVVPVDDIFLACHLAPKFHLLDKERELHSYTDLLSSNTGGADDSAYEDDSSTTFKLVKASDCPTVMAHPAMASRSATLAPSMVVCVLNLASTR
ncbi:hypothetical protein FRC11_002095 [Ceratobasidium sp. 423]|nr:hypothetical protein FRC11_002095 [Ceratobasidium sp. 423]